MWRIKVLTEQFGPFGEGWYTEGVRYWTIVQEKSLEMAVFCELQLHYKGENGWSAPIYGIGGNTVIAAEKNGLYLDDEAYKKAYTDALSVACKALGIGADVYWDNDKSKYTAADEAKRIEEEVKKTVRKKIIEIIQPKEITAQELREIAGTHNCLKLSQATEDDFNSFVEELKGWKS